MKIIINQIIGTMTKKKWVDKNENHPFYKKKKCSLILSKNKYTTRKKL